MVLGKQGPLSKMVTSGIGMTQEYRAHKKSREEAQANAQGATESSDHLQPPHSDAEGESEDDEAWAQDLDAAQGDTSTQTGNDADDAATDEDIAQAFTRSHPPPSYDQLSNRPPLEQPVILPQRRPGMRTRGWVRGYAPILAEVGIHQKEWLDFLSGFEKAIGKNRWFHVVNFAVWVADKIRLALQGVSLIARVVSAVIHLSLEMSRRGYIHTKQNKYLDKLNEDYFKPRGLYALVIKYKPKTQSSNPFSSSNTTTRADEEPIELIDLNENIAEIIGKREDDAGKFWKGLMKGAASKTTKEEEIPEFAPLIFPYLDEMSEAEKKSAMKQKGAFLADYYDRRAQTTFALDHPESKLADVAPRKEWASEYADPGNPKSQGNLISTLSGGHMQGPGARIMGRRKDRRGRLGIGGEQLPIEKRQERKAKRKSMRPMKRMLRQDALYLMVTDMPTQAEMDAVRKAIENLADD